MSMNYYANFSWTIGWEDLEKLFPFESYNLKDAVTEAGHSMDDFADAAGSEYWDDFAEEDITLVELAYAALKNRFSVEFPGLELSVEYLSSDVESEDVVPGMLWMVFNVYELVPSAKMLGDKLALSQWVTYG